MLFVRQLALTAMTIALPMALAMVLPAGAADTRMVPDVAAGDAATAPAAGPVTVKVNMARILRISAPAATVIIGNPGVADVTIQDPQTLVLTGKSFGQTNMIVLDDMGNPIADTIVEVVQAQADTMTVYMGASRTTLACAPICQPTVMLGDDPDFTSSSVASSSIVRGQAQ